MKELFVLKHDSYASGLTVATATLDNIASLNAGAFAMFNMDVLSASYGKAVDLGNATPAAIPAKFVIAYKTDDGVKLSQVIEKARAKWALKAYNAGTAKKMVIGNPTDGGTTYALNLPTLVAGQVAEIYVTNLEKPAYQTNRVKKYEYVVKTGDAAAQVVAGLIAAAAGDTIVTVAAAYTNATDGIGFTAKTAGKNFTVGVGGILAKSSVTIATSHVLPQGIPSQIQALEKECQVEDGDNDPNNRNMGDDLTTQTSQVNTSYNYDLYTISFDVAHQRALVGQTRPTQKLYLAMRTDLTAASAGNTKYVMAVIVGSSGLTPDA